MNISNVLKTSLPTLTPVWANEILTTLGIGVQYSPIVNVLLNTITISITSYDQLTYLIGILLLAAFSIMYIDKKTGGRLRSYCVIPMWRSNNSDDVVTKIDIPPGGLEIVMDKFLYKHQDYFITKPTWRFTHTTHNITGDDPRFLEINKGSANLALGTYHVRISANLEFILTYQGTDPIREQRLRFIHGDFQLLTDHFNADYSDQSKNTNRRSINIYEASLGFFRTHKLQPNSMRNRDVFKGYYHPRLDYIINWLDQLSEPIFNGQPRQFSVLCAGPPGSGKSSLCRRIAEYTNRHIVTVNLAKILSKEELYSIFYNGTHAGKRAMNWGIKNIIIEIDELDKVIYQLLAAKKLREQQEQANNFNLMQIVRTTTTTDDNGPEDSVSVDSDAPKLKVKPKVTQQATYMDWDWDLSDLLAIISGSIIPPERIIVATCNNINIIKDACPELLRSSRMSVLEFKNGDRDTFIKISMDYCNIMLSAEELPANLSFMYSDLIEFLVYEPDITKAKLLDWTSH